MNVIDCLKERGFIDTISNEELIKEVERPIKVYIGFDPTSDSLHLGNLMGIVALRWFQKFGHTPVVVLGGATASIGDPSGKSVERPLLSSEAIEANIACIRKNFERVLDFSHATAKPLVVNNMEWLGAFNMIDFLRSVGKHFRVGVMLAKESVRTRLESEEGISYTEFSYQLLQGYDFYHLLEKEGVVLQMGGTDQWGNLSAGLEFIRKVSTRSAYALTFPLITRSDGKKFGKSEEGAIWLSPEKLSPYAFYQYLVRMPDDTVITLMRLLTFMEMEEVRSYERQMKERDYIPNTAQKRLAAEITRMIHGEEGLVAALAATEAAAPGSKATLDPATFEAIAKDFPSAELKYDEVVGQKFLDLALKIGLIPSKGEGVRLIKNSGAYLNEEKVDDPTLCIEQKDLIGERYLLFGAGRKRKIILKILA